MLLVAEISENTPLAWNAPDEIVYYTVGSATVQRITQIRGIRVGDRSTRILHNGGNLNGTNYRSVEVSPDGARVYFSWGRAVAGDIDVLLATSAAPLTVALGPKSVGSHVKHSASGVAILPTPDSKGAVYAVAPDSIRMYDPATRTSRRVGEGCETPVAFSPDGARLLCRRITGNAFFIMMVSTGAVEPITVPAGTSFIHWSERGMMALRTGIGGELVLVDVSTGQSRTLLQSSDLRSAEFVSGLRIAWSSDGRRIAFASRRSNGFNRPLECVVRVVDTETGILQRVAVTKRTASDGYDPLIGAMDFAPDGRNLVYITGTPISAEAYIATVQ